MKGVIKRLFDVVISAFLLILLSPLLILIALYVRISLGSPVLFSQLRPGLNGAPFKLIKFRSMQHVQNDQGQLLPDAERLSRAGRVLRDSSLDELPELWNVLRGDMSLVGPRPLMMEYLKLYSPFQARRHLVRPGITGWAQVNGRNSLTWNERFELDVWYVENYSFVVDAKILILSLGAVLNRKGINYPGHATMQPFQGNSESET